MAYRAKGGFNRVGCSQALPVLGREVIEYQQFLTVFFKASRRFRILGLIGLHTQVEHRFGLLSGLRLPDLMQRFFGLGLRSLEQGIQYITGLMHPATLV